MKLHLPVIDMNITTMVTNSVANLKKYDLGDYKVVTMRDSNLQRVSV